MKFLFKKDIHIYEGKAVGEGEGCIEREKYLFQNNQ